MTMKRAFTLIEVNLAMLIMAGGVLSIVGLYAFGFRENRQSAEDVAAAAYADAVMSPLIMALSSTDVKWSTFRDLKSFPNEDGWAAYFGSDGLVQGDPDGKAQSAFSSVMGKVGDSKTKMSWPSTASGGLHAGLVVLHDQDSALVRIAFRAVKQSSMLLSAPIFYTEVRFQGKVE